MATRAGSGATRCASTRARKTSVRLASVVVVAVVAAGCSAQAKRAKGDEFCDHLQQLQTSVAQVKSVDPKTVTVDQARAALHTLQGQLDQLVAAADDPISLDVSNLQVAIDELRQTVTTAGASALTTARPLVVDAKKNVLKAARALRENVAGRCPST